MIILNRRANPNIDSLAFCLEISPTVKYAQEHGTKSGKPIGRERTPITDNQVQTTFNANNNNFSATPRALTNNIGVEVSAGFAASRIKLMAAKEPLQRSGVKIGFSDT